MHAFNAGELAASIEHLESARGHAGQGRYLVLRASIELTYMWLALTFRSLETPLAALPNVRLAVARAGDSTLLAQLRIYVGRTEARRGSLVEAQRHYSLADQLLVNNPNVWLQGILEIDRSVVHMLLGDNEAAFAAAELGSVARAPVRSPSYEARGGNKQVARPRTNGSPRTRAKMR